MKHLFIDSAPTGILSTAKYNLETMRLEEWGNRMQAAGHTIYLPEIIDYELRRELIRAGRLLGIAKLDALAQRVVYLPLTTDALRLAADWWARQTPGSQPAIPPKLTLMLFWRRRPCAGHTGHYRRYAQRVAPVTFH